MGRLKRFVTVARMSEGKRRSVVEAEDRREAVRQFMERFGYDPGFDMEEVATND